MRARFILLPFLGLALLAAAACSSKIVICPVPAILADTSTITVMRPGTTPDLANELYTVKLIDAQSDCALNESSGVIRSSLNLTFRATRAPSRDRASYSVPYFVVATEGAKIYSKRLYMLRFEFAPDAASATITQSPDDTQIQLMGGKLPWNYQLMSGFQLTPAQIEYNKTRSRYLP
ncbi:MAG TPA: hypothetical protein VG821_02960 [Rhizomicrobium sp.]|jgi:hypothetical protein|nr:hypothetical protein [Rhizomicrobium sp.]